MLEGALRAMLRKAGYAVLPSADLEALRELAEGRRQQTAPEPASAEPDHQADSQKYHARTGTGDMDRAFLPIYAACRAYSMTSPDRMFALYKAVEYLVRAEIPGAIAECGVWRGGSMMLVAETLRVLGDTSRELYLYDTFEGLPKPDEVIDVDIWGNRAIDGWRPHAIDERSSTWARAGLEEVRANLLKTGYPEARLHLVKGLVEETLPHLAPERIALLRLDTDWYASTRHELEHLFPRLVRNGVLIADDYGHFQGARQAVDEYIGLHKLALLLVRVDYSGRVALKNFDGPRE